jgi:phage-related protein
MTTWTYGGTALSSLGKVTLINDYLDIASRRGDNITIPFRHGSIFTQKYYDQRTLSFGIAVTASSAANLESTFDTMRALFAPMTQQTLAMTLESAAVRNISATVDRPIQVERVTNTFARVVVEFTCTEPFWRLSTVIADNTTTINASPKAMVVANPGTAIETNPTIILTGPLSNTVITNSTTGSVLTYTGTIASPRVVTIVRSSTGEYTATNDLAANVIANVTHSGTPEFMRLNPGNNSLSIADDTATTGTVKMSFYAPFL